MNELLSAVGRGLGGILLLIPKCFYRALVVDEQRREGRRQVLRDIAAEMRILVANSQFIGIGSGGEAKALHETAAAAARLSALGTEIEDPRLHELLKEFEHAARPFTDRRLPGDLDRPALRSARDKVADQLQELQAALR